MRSRRLRKRHIIYLVIAAVLLVAFCYVAIRMARAVAQTWDAPVYQGLQVPFSENNALDSMQFLEIAPYSEPETVLVRDGWVYASVKGGILIRLREDGSGLEEVLNTGTAILGFAFDGQGNIVYCDSAYDKDGGAVCFLPAEETSFGEPILLVAEVDGTRLAYPDAVAVAFDGKIYFTDACKYSPAAYNKKTMHAFNLDMMVHSNTGALYVYDPATKETELIVSGLCFANGVALTPNETHLLVNETCEYRIWKVDANLRNARAGDTDTEIIADNLPGFPDNLTAVGDGTYWIGLSGSRSDFIDGAAAKTMMRNMILLLPSGWMDQLLSSSEAYSHIVRIDSNGEILENLMGEATNYNLTTGATQAGDRCYIHGLDTQSHVGWISIQ